MSKRKRSEPEEDNDDNMEDAIDFVFHESSQDAAAIAGGGNPDKSPWPVRFTKDEFDGVNNKLNDSQSTDAHANTRKVLQWISAKSNPVEGGDGEISYVMAVDALNEFPIEEGKKDVQEPRMEEPQTSTNEPLLDGRDFLQSLLKAMYDNSRWKGYDLTVEMESEDLVSTKLNRHPTPQEAMKYFDDRMTDPPVWIRSTSPERHLVEFEKVRFTQAVIDDTYVKSKRAKAVREFLQGTHGPILDDKNMPGFVFSPISINYVERESSGGEPLSAILSVDLVALGKRRCIVVAGESGSGKTTFAVKSCVQQGYDVFYAAIQQDDYDNTYGPPKDGLQTCRDTVQKVIDAVETLSDENFSSGPREQFCLDLLFNVKKYLNTSRNAWARQVAERAWTRVLREKAESQTDLDDWWDGKLEQRDRPSRLAIILDEVTNLALSEGLVDICRNLMFKFEHTLAQGRVSFVLCGTGLDDLRSPQRIGTDPSKFSVVIVKQPDFDALQKEEIITSVERHAIDKGVYGRVLSKNSRMLFQAVLPIVKVFFLRLLDPNENNEREVLLDVTSNWVTMRYAVILYMASNTIGKLSKEDKNELLKYAYLYHLLLDLFDARTGSCPLLDYSNEILWLSKHKNVIRLLSLMLKRKKIPEGHIAFAHEFLGASATTELLSSNRSPDIFAAGLVADKTSVALKYLACRGKVDPLAKSDGAGFEAMVGASLARMMEALGYQVNRVRLKQAWPHKATKNTGYTKEDIAKLKEKLEKYGKNATEEVGDNVGGSGNDGIENIEETSWTSFLCSDELQCIIFRQGVSDAQGPDLFMLYQCGNSGEMLLDSIQAKHRKVPPISELLKWFQSVGVTSTCSSPDSGKAGWSYAGLEAFRNFLRSQSKKSVTLGRRIVASSSPAADWQKLSSDLQGAFEQESAFAAVRIWSKDMFEPMISVLEDTRVHESEPP